VSFLTGNVVLADGSKGQGVMLTAEILLVQTLKRGGAILILFACVVCTRENFLSSTGNEHVGLDTQHAR